MKWLALMLLLAACAPVEQPHLAASAPPLIAGDMLLAHDGALLPLQLFVPKTKPRAVIVALHGFNDYSNGFLRTGLYFQKRGIALLAYDQRGFGRAPHRGVWAGRENLIADANTAVRAARKRFPRTPVYVMGESMGGAVALLAFSGEAGKTVDGVILSAPAVWGRQSMNQFYQATLWATVHIAPDMTLTGSEVKILACNNYPVLRRMGMDPIIIKETRIDAIYGLVGLMTEAHDAAARLTAPTLLLYGEQDQVIPPEAIDTAFSPRSNMKFIYYPEGYHMLTRDMQGDEVLADITQWVLKR